MSSTGVVRTLALGAFAIICIGAAHAQQCEAIVLPIGNTLYCNIDAYQTAYADSNQNIYTAASTGMGGFTVTSTSLTPCTAVLQPAVISITSIEPTLGTITTTLDPTRNATPSRITSIMPGIAFPATEDIYFHARMALSSRPGIVYRSIQEIHLNSMRVISFNPHSQERFNLIRKVDFEDIHHPGIIVFTLLNFSIILDGPR